MELPRFVPLWKTGRSAPGFRFFYRFGRFRKVREIAF